tara:strand:+ start:270 stop:497 length:228 start_codon:yes stop_codon:yes gene_type:complete
MTNRSITIGDFLTDKEIKRALSLYRKTPEKFHKLCKEKIIAPNIERINAKLGQENDQDFLAFAVEYSIMRTVPQT